MAFKLFSDVRETSTTGGTGDQILAGALDGSYFPFSARYGTGDTLFYCIKQGAAREVGLGTYASGNKLSRTQVYKSTNADALVNFAVGTVDIFVTNIAPDDLDANGRSLQLGALGFTTVGKALAGAADAAAGRTAIGAASTAGGTISGAYTFRTGSDGSVQVAPGNASLPGLVGFYTPDNVRRGYIGWGNGNYLTLTSDNSWGWRFAGSVAPLFDTAPSIRAGTLGVQTSLMEWGWSTGSVAWRPTLENNAALTFYAYNTTGGAYIGPGFTVTQAGSMSVPGTLTAGSKSFLIDHPTQPAEKDLVFMATEAPMAGVEFWGTARLVDGLAVVDIDAASNMSAGTFNALTQRAIVNSLNNQDSFTQVRAGRVVDGKFTIYAIDTTCTDEVAWHVVAERADPYIKTVEWCDPVTGRLIPEHDKPDYPEAA